MGLPCTNNKNPLWGRDAYWVSVLVLYRFIVYRFFSHGCAYAFICNQPCFSPSFLSITSLPFATTLQLAVTKAQENETLILAGTS